MQVIIVTILIAYYQKNVISTDIKLKISEYIIIVVR